MQATPKFGAKFQVWAKILTVRPDSGHVRAVQVLILLYMEVSASINSMERATK